VIGKINYGTKVPRSGKWAESPDFTKDFYPPWPQGACGHVVSRPIANYVAGNKDRLISYQGEDSSLAIWLDESPLKDNIVWETTKRFTNQGNCQDTRFWIIGHNISPTRMRECFAHTDEIDDIVNTPEWP